jgi:hypothetical protein
MAVPHVDLRGLGIIGCGALLFFVGYVWFANLFGVVDEKARRTRRSWFVRRRYGPPSDGPTDPATRKLPIRSDLRKASH